MAHIAYSISKMQSPNPDCHCMILNKSIAPAEGEFSVKSYVCTSLRSLVFNMTAYGYLEITNKRLLLQELSGHSLSTPHIIHCEVPLSEVAGINIYRAQRFNGIRLLAGTLLLAGWVPAVAVLSNVPLLSLQSTPASYQATVWLLFAMAVYGAYGFNRQPVSHRQHAKDGSWKELLLIGIGLGIISTLAKDAVSYTPFSSSLPALLVALATMAYALVRFSQQAAFSLRVHTRGSHLPVMKVTAPVPASHAGKAPRSTMSGQPAKDSLLVIKELGALILDIQLLGEPGIDKWRINKSI
ncbi:hypothetical protein [Paraflavitalea pollutisoli]|uniref:hypothetical protein n=1 Tax=Paraflavitalea pollutisoli TaxID=3034143 RepID=UPI0023ED49DC|nr:hypothetical protein [Paraflavitalea sp. H1-2-19X]